MILTLLDSRSRKNRWQIFLVLLLLKMEDEYIAQIKEWIESFVIRYNLCPFARKVFIQDKIRYTTYVGNDLTDLANSFQDELLFLKRVSAQKVDTSFIILPHVLEDFSDYLDFIELANDLIFALDLRDYFQIASFHPDYQFAGTSYEDVTNYTNRSPYPLLHLLREESISEALLNYENPADIPARNMERMRQVFNK